MDKKRILIADDHAAIRMGLKYILLNHFSHLEFGEAHSGEQVIRMMMGTNREKWDLLILDIRLNGSNGIEVLKTIVKGSLDTQVLIFSIYSEEQMAIRCFKNGAHGYLNKSASDNEIVLAVKTLISGKRYISESITHSVLSFIGNHENILPHQRLSDREYEILLMIGIGNTISGIANDLNLSISTINTYRARILKKMGFTNNAGIISYVIRNNLQPD